MNKLLIRVLALSSILEICILFTHPIVRPAGAAPPAGYTLVWSDEFNGTALDTINNWGYRQPGVARHDAINIRDAVKVSGGLLTITTYTKDGTHYTGMIQTGEGSPGDLTPSGNKYKPKYGYVEARIEFQGSPGMWSSFWMQSDSTSHPAPYDPHFYGTEIDIVEHPVVKAYDGTCTPSPTCDISSQGSSSLLWDGYCSVNPDAKSAGGDRHSGVGGLDTGFHTYGLEWTPDVENVYYDGVLVWTVNNSTQQDPPTQIPCPWAPHSPQSPSVSGPVSHRNEFIILSSEVFNAPTWCGSTPALPHGYGTLGPPDPSETRMIVDYVRHYQLLTAPSGLTATPVSCSQINLAWTDNSFAEDNYIVARSPDGVTFSQIATLAANTQSYQDTGLTNGTPYWYRVWASAGAGNGAYSTANATTTATDAVPPADISGLQTSTGKTSIALTWTAPGDDGNVGTAAQYELRYSTSQITPANFPSATLVTTSPPRTAGSLECRLIAGLACTPTTYYAAIRARDECNNWSAITNFPSGTPQCSGGVASCGQGGAARMPIPMGEGALSFSPPSPNPVREAMGFQVQIPGNLQGATFRVDVFDVAGRRVRSLVDRTASQGQAQVDWNLLDDSGRRVASGLYQVRVDIGDTRKTFPLLVIR